ncbi:MAG TPA: N-acetylglucosamine-6-phosphate deacetylase [Bacillota bacterium]
MNSKACLCIKNVKIYRERQKVTIGSIYIKNGMIAQIFDEHESLEPMISASQSVQVIDGKGLNLIPGLIDGHIHGANGADVMDGTKEALNLIATTLPKEGTTSFLATTITQSPENIEVALKNIRNYESKRGQAELLGVHLEGPFIEPSKKGAQPGQYIIKPDFQQFHKWQKISGNRIKTVTMAPEHDETGQFIERLFHSGVNVSAGHTAASFSEMKQAITYGVRQVTHLCNAMSGIHHRDIGVVGAAFQLEQLRAEIIADGIHISPEMLQIIYDHIGSERLMLITDAMRAKGLPSGTYELGGQPVTVLDHRAVLEDGTLAGSVLKMIDAAKQMILLDGVTIHQVIEMASANPAKQLGIYETKGSIAVGKDADVLLVDDDLNIKYSICRGMVAFKEE